MAAGVHLPLPVACFPNFLLFCRTRMPFDGDDRNSDCFNKDGNRKFGKQATVPTPLRAAISND
jgi:hypothetical protein